MTAPTSRVAHDVDGLNTAARPADLLVEFVTPAEVFFTRSHAQPPEIDAREWRLEVTGLVRRPLRLSLADLPSQAQREVAATLACAGIRRSEFLALGPLPGELPWGPDCLGHGRWSGVPLGAILAESGLLLGAAHVEFVGWDSVERHGKRFGFGGSVDLDKALDPDVLVALDLNGAPLPTVHGFPARTVVPGWIGARSVKWLREIRVSSESSANYFQTEAYRVQSIADPSRPRDVSRGVPLTALPINSAILEPAAEQRAFAGQVTVRGWAIGHGARPIATVEISLDDGHSWRAVDTIARGGRWGWSRWTAVVALAPGRHRLAVRAADETGSCQPANLRDAWNVKGYCNNAWHRIAIVAE